MEEGATRDNLHIDGVVQHRDEDGQSVRHITLTDRVRFDMAPGHTIEISSAAPIEIQWRRPDGTVKVLTR